jgi:hypothetical protein
MAQLVHQNGERGDGQPEAHLEQRDAGVVPEDGHDDDEGKVQVDGEAEHSTA